MHWLGQLFVVFMLLGLAADATAQSAASSVRGDVTDSSGAAIVGAHVALRSPSTGFSASGVTDFRGEYRFHEIPSGTYAISVTEQGFLRNRRSSSYWLTNRPL
jgi:hypothetical protein